MKYVRYCVGWWGLISHPQLGLDAPAYTVGTKLYCLVTEAHVYDKKHLKNVGPIRHCEPLHCHSPGVATVARRLRIDVHNGDDDDNNDNDNA